MVNQNKIFLFKIKRKTKNLFSSDVERTIEADVTLFEWFESKDTNGFRRWQERLTLVPKEWQHICNYIEFKMLYRVIRDVIHNTWSAASFVQCVCDVFKYLFISTNLSSYEPQREKTYLLICAHNEYSNQPVRCPHDEASHSSLSKIDQRRFRSDCANAQSDLNLRWAHIVEGTFSDVAVHIYEWSNIQKL